MCACMVSGMITALDNYSGPVYNYGPRMNEFGSSVCFSVLRL